MEKCWYLLIKMGSQLLSRKLCLRYMAGLLTRSFRSAAFPKHFISVAFWQIFKSLQQRELSRIFTGFPIEPLRHQISLQKYEILLIYFKNRKNQSANFLRKFKGLIFSVFKNNQRKSGLGTVYFQTDFLWLFLF